MGFFDKKEDVLDIELTQYGKYLLSKGKFIPVFYSFFDDDIIYDWTYTGDNAEKQNYAEDRLLLETPSSRVQYVFSGRETKVSEINDMVRHNEAKLRDVKIQQTPERHYALSAPLGNSSLNKSYDPAWGVRAYLGKFSKIVKYQQGAQPTLRIPQLSMDEIEYKTEIVIDSPPDPTGLTGSPTLMAGDTGGVGTSGELELATQQYADGSYISVRSDPVLLEIEEANVPCLRENFEIEVFLIEEEDMTGKIYTPSLPTANQKKTEKLIPLSFVKRYSNIKNGILLDDKEVGWQDEIPDLDGTFVENYFEIFVDREIDTAVLCAAGVKPDTKRCGTFTSDWLRCPDTRKPGDPTISGLYDSDAEGPFGEDC